MNANSKITITPITDPMQLCCPHCGAVALVVGAHDSGKPDFGAALNPPPRYWIDGGENLDIGPELSPAQAAADGFYTTLHGGRCDACGEGYSVHAVKFFAAAASRFFIESYVMENVPMGVTHFQCAHEGETWLMTDYQTPEGPIVGHWFGPEPQADDADAEVRAARADLLRLWDDLPRSAAVEAA